MGDVPGHLIPIVELIREHRPDPTELAEFTVALTPTERDLVEQAVATVDSGEWKSSPAAMAQYLTRDTSDPLTMYPVHELISNKIVDAVEGSTPNIAIACPARVGKSQTATVWGTVWALTHHPDWDIVIVSYASDLALEHAKRVRDIINEHGPILGVELRADIQAKGHIGTTADGSVRATSIKGSLTGLGADIIFIDDPIKGWAEAHSRANRKAVWDFYQGTARKRLNRDDAALCVIHTRWHQEDLIGQLLASEEKTDWEYLRIPALCDDPETDPLGREEGEPIACHRSPEWFFKQKLAGEARWLAMEQQTPSPPGGVIIQREWLDDAFYMELPEVDEWVSSWDFSFGSKTDTASFVVGQVWAKAGGNRYLVYQVRDRMTFPGMKAAVLAVAGKFPQITAHLVEDKADGPAIIQELKSKVAGLIPVAPRGDKELRLHAVSGVFQAGNVFIPDPSLWPEVAEWIEEIVTFPQGRYDDMVDTTSQALAYWQTPLEDQVGVWSGDSVGPSSVPTVTTVATPGGVSGGHAPGSWRSR